MLVEALNLFGVSEKEGDADNPEILKWAKEIGYKNEYTHDSIPWCGLFVAVVAKRAGKSLPNNPLWARNWSHWGAVCAPELGAVLVFSRGTGGHVGLYVGEDNHCFHVLGGNQGDSVCITRIEKSRLIAARCMYKHKPKNVRPVRIIGVGDVSKSGKPQLNSYYWVD